MTEQTQNQNSADCGQSLSTEGLATPCPECGSQNTEWFCTQHTNSGVVDGRLRMHDVHTMFVLGCCECSETIKTMTGDDVARILNVGANVPMNWTQQHAPTDD